METDGSGALKADLQDIPKIYSARCSGCGRCVAACPEKLFTLETFGFHKSAVILNSESCSSCGRCLEACPVAAILY